MSHLLGRNNLVQGRCIFFLLYSMERKHHGPQDRLLYIYWSVCLMALRFFPMRG